MVMPSEYDVRDMMVCLFIMPQNDGYVKLIDKMLHRLLKNIGARGLRN